MPLDGISQRPHRDLLSFEEIVAVAKEAVGLGISRIRLTGGEPLIRKHLYRLVGQLAALDGLEDLSLSTNGTLLAEHAQQLKDAGLNRVNVSLDSLVPETYRRITRVGELRDALEGIEVAQRTGLQPVKVNVVVMRGVNDHEVEDFARMSQSHGWNVRFIEPMPLTQNMGVVPAREMLQRLEAVFRLVPDVPTTGNGPAKYYRIEGAAGTIGLITPVSQPFCATCSRLRLTSLGQLRPCLLSDEGTTDLKMCIRNGGNPSQIRHLISEAVLLKPSRYSNVNGDCALNTRMSEIGG
jgi:cyclic pyranopterin phosphate synthase